MKLSIITVAFNSAKTIQASFDSVRRQRDSSIEYIVIDGQSSDGTVDIIKANQDIISHWVSERDSGLYDAMNKGIAVATGEYVGILNSDDVFCDEHVLARVAAFHRHHRNLTSVGNITQRNAMGKTVRNYSAKSWKPDRLKRGFMPPHPAMFFPRNWFAEYGLYRTDFRIGADYELISRFFLKHGLPWKYSNVTTTSMLQGGLSTAGFDIYWFVTEEIERALELNDIRYSKAAVRLRFLWKLLGYLPAWGEV